MFLSPESALPRSDPFPNAAGQRAALVCTALSRIVAKPAVSLSPAFCGTAEQAPVTGTSEGGTLVRTRLSDANPVPSGPLEALCQLLLLSQPNTHTFDVSRKHLCPQATRPTAEVHFRR